MVMLQYGSIKERRAPLYYTSSLVHSNQSASTYYGPFYESNRII